MADATTIQTTTENYVASGVIANGESVSDTFKIGGRRLVKIQSPTITSATLSFLVQNTPGGDFQDLYDDEGNEVTVGSAYTTARTFIVPELASFYAFQIRSGTSGSPVSQGAERTFIVAATGGKLG
jgi:hypothetical protein